MRSFLTLLAIIYFSGPADAKFTKYYYLKMGAESALAFKSKAACETYARRWTAELRKVEKFTKTKIKSLPRCLDAVPSGFQRPRG
jgi:hypothetical protein